MELTFKRDTVIRKQYFAPESFAHPAKMDCQLLIWIVEHYTEAGETILDPMSGMGTTMLACTVGRNVIGVELEQKFVDMAKANWEKVRMMPQLGHTMGDCQILQGDARQLEGLLVEKIVTSPPYWAAKDHRVSQKLRPGRSTGLAITAGDNPSNIGNLPYGKVDSVITSPPYAETGVGDWKTGRAEFQAWVLSELATKGYIEWQGNRYTESEWRAMNHGRIDGRTTKGVHKHPTDGYSNNPDNLGNKPYGKIDSIITSPPYEASVSDNKEGPGAGSNEAKYGRWKDGTAKKHSYTQHEVAVDHIITSPPYENQVHGGTALKPLIGGAGEVGQPMPDGYGDNNANIGNLKSDSYLSAMLQVYKACHKVLKPHGLMILVTKNFIRNRQVIRLDLDTIKLCEQAGFTFLERHYRKLPAQSFWRTIYYKKNPDVEKLEYEDILVFEANSMVMELET